MKRRSKVLVLVRAGGICPVGMRGIGTVRAEGIGPVRKVEGGGAPPRLQGVLVLLAGAVCSRIRLGAGL